MTVATTTYCVLPKGTAPEVVEALRQRLAGEPVEVIIDRRSGDRTPGRFKDERRRPVQRWSLRLGIEAPQGARFESHLPPVGHALAEVPLEELIPRAAAHEPQASAEFRWRCRRPVRAQLLGRLRHEETVDRVLPDVLDAVQDALADYSGHLQFDAWLAATVEATPVVV